MSDPDVLRICQHEIGHFIVASHFGIPSYPEITLSGVSMLATEDAVSSAGICHLELPVSPFRMACVAWAGTLAECMADSRPAWAPPFKPTTSTLRDWHWMALRCLPFFSKSDASGIRACYRRSWRACKTAFGILRRNRSRQNQLTALLVEAEEKRKAADEASWNAKLEGLRNGPPLPESAYTPKWNIGETTT